MSALSRDGHPDVIDDNGTQQLSLVHVTQPKQTAALMLLVEHLAQLVIQFQTFRQGAGAFKGYNMCFHFSVPVS